MYTQGSTILLKVVVYLHGQKEEVLAWVKEKDDVVIREEGSFTSVHNLVTGETFLYATHVVYKITIAAPKAGPLHRSKDIIVEYCSDPAIYDNPLPSTTRIARNSFVVSVPHDD